MKKGFAEFLARAEADIVGVQEVRALYEEIPDEAREPPAGTRRSSPPSAGDTAGVGIYSRLVPERVETGLGVPQFDVEGRYIAAHFRSERGRFAVVNAYFPKGDGKNRDNSRVPYKLDFYRAVFERVERMRRRCPVLVIGDYNTAHREIDLARPKANVKNSGFLPVERAEIDRWLEAGWVDASARCTGMSRTTTAGGRSGAARGAQRRLADRLRAGLTGRDEAGGGRLHLARPDGLRPLPRRRRHRPLARTMARCTADAGRVRIAQCDGEARGPYFTTRRCVSSGIPLIPLNRLLKNSWH